MSTPCLFPPSSHLPGIARLKVREAKPFATGPTAGQLQWISSAREVHQKRMGRWDGLRKVEIMDLVGGALEPWNYIWLLMVNIIYNQLFWIGKSTIIITGWWWLEPWNFMTFHILGIIIIPTDELIFFGGVETTNQWTKGGIFHGKFRNFLEKAWCFFGKDGWFMIFLECFFGKLEVFFWMLNPKSNQRIP